MIKIISVVSYAILYICNKCTNQFIFYTYLWLIDGHAPIKIALVLVSRLVFSYIEA